MWTTTRYASKDTRDKAESLAHLTKSKYFARGKRTIAQLVDFARQMGFERIRIVGESSGKPSWIKFLEVLPAGNWQWLETKELDVYESKSKP